MLTPLFFTFIGLNAPDAWYHIHIIHLYDRGSARAVRLFRNLHAGP